MKIKEMINRCQSRISGRVYARDGIAPTIGDLSTDCRAMDAGDATESEVSVEESPVRPSRQACRTNENSSTVARVEQKCGTAPVQSCSERSSNDYTLRRLPSATHTLGQASEVRGAGKSEDAQALQDVNVDFSLQAVSRPSACNRRGDESSNIPRNPQLAQQRSLETRVPGGAQTKASPVLLESSDVLANILTYHGDDAYVFVAGVSSQWRAAWGNREKRTSLNAAVRSRTCLAWAVASGCPPSPALCCQIAISGSLDILRYARQLGVRWDATVCAAAAGTEYLSIFIWARAHGCPWDSSTCDAAAKNGRLENLKWARAKGCPWTVFTCASAASGGHLPTLKWLHANGCPCDWRGFAAATKAGHLEVLRWSKEHGCPWDRRAACSAAVVGGHLDVLKWCRANGCPWDKHICASAAYGGHLEILKWCRSNGCGWDVDTCISAAFKGHLEILKWCRENGCPWTKRTCEAAAQGGHISVLSWCRDNGCPWDGDTCRTAAFYGRDDVLAWCIANGCPYDAKICTEAAIKGKAAREAVF